MDDYSIPVMFDVQAPSRAAAATILADRLHAAHVNGLVQSAGGPVGVEAWWLIEAGDKAVDGNDRDCGTVVFTRTPPDPELDEA